MFEELNSGWLMADDDERRGTRDEINEHERKLSESMVDGVCSIFLTACCRMRARAAMVGGACN